MRSIVTDEDVDSKSSRCFVCRRCHYSWTGEDEPVLCPRCKSCRWTQGREVRYICPYCAHVWFPQETGEPCPCCGRDPHTRGKSRHTCVRCEYIWIQDGKIPGTCPLCHTTKWLEGSSFRHTCNMCGHIWRNKTHEPKRCPKCYSELWNAPRVNNLCKRCGYRWTSRSALGDKTTICPRCKSKFWRTPPRIITCAVCGKIFATSRDNVEKCGDCSGKNLVFPHRCMKCGTEWESHRKYAACPECGENEEIPQTLLNTTVWSEKGRELVLTIVGDVHTVYLLEKGIPLSAARLPDVLNLLDVTYNEFFNGTAADLMPLLAEKMFDRRDDYADRIDFIMELLHLDEMDSTILALHMDSMSPEFIAMKLGMSDEDVHESFDRIRHARDGFGVNITDSIPRLPPFDDE